MKRVVNLAVLTSTILSLPAAARVIYGEDGRKDIHEAKEIHQKLARSTPTMVPLENIVDNSEAGTTDLLQTTFQEWIKAQGEEEESPLMSKINIKNNEEKLELNFCPGERFADQPNPGMCSGFLIAPDLVVTAGHCAELPAACEGYKWVFDFKVDPQTGMAGKTVNPSDIYSCKRIVSKSLDTDLGTDFAVFQLDRKVEGRVPLEINYSGTIGDKAEIVVIGNPSGLPLKVTEGGKVRTNEHPMYFSATLDTYQGNSGSAVFNAETNMIEGILVRGENDFNMNPEQLCIESNRCKEDECRGEDVSRITSIPEVALHNDLVTASEEGDIETLGKIMKLKTWVDFYAKDGQSPLMKAAAKGTASSIKVLLENGASANLTDANGDTALHHLARVLKKGNVAALTALLNAGADLTVRNSKGQTPIKAALKAKNFMGAYMLMKAKRSGKSK